MLKPLLGSRIKETILLFLYTRGESYPREIAKTFSLNLSTVQNQLQKLEYGGVVYSKLRGQVRLFGFNPRYHFKKELDALLEKSLQFVPAKKKRKYYTARLRPRRTGKPL